MTRDAARSARLVRAACVGGLIALAPLAARAQDSCDCAAPTLPVRWSIFVSTGAATLQTSQINALLGPAGYFAVSNDAVGTGAGAFSSFGPLRLGVEHVRLDGGSESTPTGLSARIEARYTAFTVGWDLRPRRRLSIAPTLGVGRGSYLLTVGDRNGGATAPVAPPPTFNEILAAPGSSSRINGKAWIFEPMLAADLLILRRSSERLGITLGARVGYRFAPNRPDWQYRGEAVAGGPIDQAKGPVARITFGVGGR
jgi:hypothetical protein